MNPSNRNGTTSNLPPLSRSPNRPSKITLGRLFGLVVLIAGIGSMVKWTPSFFSSQRSNKDVLISVVVRGNLTIQVTDRGELESSNSVEVRCDIEGGGKLVTITPEGSLVRKGEVVVKFDADPLLKTVNEQEVKWEQAEGKVKTAKSELEVAKNKADSEIAKANLTLTLAKLDHESYIKGEYQVEVEKRKGNLELARKELKETQDNLEFTRNMVKRGFAQLEQVRVKELEVKQKEFLVQSNSADLRMLEEFTKVRKMVEFKAKAEDAERELTRTQKSQEAAIEKADSELKSASKTATLEKRQLERIRQQLESCEIKAPQDGIVVYFKRPWDESSRIRPGAMVFFQQQIFNLPDLTKMQVKMKIHESVVKKVKKGLKATLQIDALPNQVLNGTVESVATLAQSEDWRGGGVKEYQTIIKIDDLPAEAGLKPGMTGEVKIHVKTLSDVLIVPVQTVTELDGKFVCYVVTENDIEKREVEVGEGNEQSIEIKSGVVEGEHLALDARLRAMAERKSRTNNPNAPNNTDKSSGESAKPETRTN